MESRKPRINGNYKLMKEIMEKIKNYTLEEMEDLVLAHNVRKAQKEDKIRKRRIENEQKKEKRRIIKEIEEALLNSKEEEINPEE